MKIIALFFSILCLLISCSRDRSHPDLSGIHITLRLERFDEAFFSMDSNQVRRDLFTLNQQYPYFLNDFLVNILGATPLSDTSEMTFRATRAFLTSYRPVRDSLGRSYAHVEWLEKELRQGFAYLRYYFPDYHLPPKVVCYIGPFDAPAVALTRYTLAIGLQLFAGRDFSFYRSAQGQEMYPAYISRRFEAPYIVPDCMQALAEDIFPDSSGSRPLIEQMIEKGKYWWLLSRFLPDAPDSLISGFTQKQLNWCKANEGMIWNQILQNDLFSIDQDLIKNYIGESPSTPGMPDASPGNIGQWVGWQIVKQFAEKNPSLSPRELMQSNARTLFETSRYKPR